MKNYERWCKYKILIHLFFASFILNIFITFYSIYLFFEMSIFHGLQGSKLKLKSPTNFK